MKGKLAVEEYGPAVARALETVCRQQRWLLQERAEGCRRVQRLLPLNQLQRRLLVRNAASYRTWAVARGLLEAARTDESPTDLAHLVLEMLPDLNPATCRAAMLRDLEALAWALLARTRRRQGRSGDFAEALVRAHRAALRGTGDQDVWARIWALCRKRSHGPVASARIDPCDVPSRAALLPDPRKEPSGPPSRSPSPT